MTTKSSRKFEIHARLRVRLGDKTALGPGKIELPESVQQTGSITKAAKRMGMSYMRAWELIQTMNQCFKEPIIQTSRGGKDGGGAQITEVGRQALLLYQKMERDTLRVCKDSGKKLQRLLRM
jgi:molybdate transport system regulatory protein